MDHIAVLHCDDTSPQIIDKYGDLGDMCVALLKNCNCQLPGIKYTVYTRGDSDNIDDQQRLNQVYQELLTNIENNTIKGVMIGGSAADSFDTKSWISRLDEFLRNVVLIIPNFPIIGICFGHQIICKNLGCKVGRNHENSWECGITTINLNPDVFLIKDLTCIDTFKQQLALDNQINHHLNLPQIHRDIVYGIPKSRTSNFISIGSTAKCSNQGIITESGPIKVLTFQGHPELTTQSTIDLLYDTHSHPDNDLDRVTLEKGIYNTKMLNNQGDLVGKLITSFINSLVE